MSNQLLDAALEYAKRGWPVFPCDDKKRALVKEWQHVASTDPATIRKWWDQFPAANIAVVPGNMGMMVVEIDSYKDEFDKAKFDALGLPETQLRANSPSGGEHWYYALAEGEKVAPSQSRLAPCVDVRSYGSYVLVPPSTFNGKPYAWQSQGKPAYRTDAMVEKAKSPREKRADRHKWIIEPDQPENIARAIKWLKEEAKIAVEHVNGDHLVYATAAHLKSLGISAEKTLELMIDVWNPRCQPPWDDFTMFEEKIGRRMNSNTSAPGNMTAAYKEAKAREWFTPAQPGEPQEPYEGRFQVSTVPELESRPEPKWLLDEVIPEKGYAILYGPPGAFKTFLALDIALSIAHWQPWHGRAVKLGRVLYCLGEGAFDAHKRIRAWLQHHDCKLDPEAFKVIEPAPLLKLDSDKTDFLKAAEHFGPWDLVVVDTVGRVMAGIDDNGALGARTFTEFATAIRLRLGAATLAITHAPKDRPEVLLGSGAYEADADTIYNATIAAKGDTINLRQHKIKYGAPWEKAIGFRKVAIGESMALEPCAPVKTIRDKESLVGKNYEAQFLMALSKRGEATWPDIKADMCAMNEIPTLDRDRFKGRLDNWFKRWSRNSEFATGERSANQSLVLRMPT